MECVLLPPELAIASAVVDITLTGGIHHQRPLADCCEIGTGLLALIRILGFCAIQRICRQSIEPGSSIGIGSAL